MDKIYSLQMKTHNSVISKTYRN